jgi:hypothetical protein
MMSYEEWLEQVDQEVQSRVGIDLHSLEDCTLRDWYDDEIAPADAAAMALDNDTLYSSQWRALCGEE